MEEKWRYRNEFIRADLFLYGLHPFSAKAGLEWKHYRSALDHFTRRTLYDTGNRLQKNPQASKSCITILQVIASNLASHTFNIFWMPESFCVNFRPFTASAIIGNSYCSNGQSFNTSILLFSVMILNTWRLY